MGRVEKVAGAHADLEVIVADQALDNAILKKAAKGNF